MPAKTATTVARRKFHGNSDPTRRLTTACCAMTCPGRILAPRDARVGRKGRARCPCGHSLYPSRPTTCLTQRWGPPWWSPDVLAPTLRACTSIPSPAAALPDGAVRRLDRRWALADILERQNQERAKHVQPLFEAFFRDRLVVGGESEGSDGEATVSWRQETASGLAAYGERGRVRDLIVIPRPDGEGGSIHGGLIQPLLFDSGRPLLIAPPVAPGSVGECVVIAWNGSMESARTLALAMPFVVSTDRLVLLTVEASAVPGTVRRGRRRKLDATWRGSRNHERPRKTAVDRQKPFSRPPRDWGPIC